jgi:hypothetical protein
MARLVLRGGIRRRESMLSRMVESFMGCDLDDEILVQLGGVCTGDLHGFLDRLLWP